MSFNLLCAIGLHRWEKEPSTLESIRSTGFDIVFFSEGMQLGSRKCLRTGCCAIQTVYRTGFVGIGKGTSTKWKKASENMRRRISALPIL